MIETRLLRNALKLAKCRNFARAAEELHISQPTLSRSIQLLEKIVGERLFDRTTRTILPTKTGEIVLKHASIIVASGRALREEVGRHQGLTEGSLFIGTGPYAGTELIAPAIGRFSRQFPDIKIEIRVGDWRKLPKRWTQEDFDFLVVETSELADSPDFEITRLIRHPAFFLCRKNHPLFEKDSLAIHDLSLYPMVSPALPRRLIGSFSKLLFPDRDTDLPFINVQKITCNDLGAIKATLLESDSIGIATLGIVAQELECDLLKVLPFRVKALSTDHHIVKRKGVSLSPSARAFIEILLEVDKERSVMEADLVESLGPDITI